MATLQDVKAFVKTLNNLDSQELESKVAAEFSMSHDEAKQMLRGIESEETDSSMVTPTFLPSAVVAVGLAGAGAMSQSAGLMAVMHDKITAEPSEKMDKDSE